MRAPHHTFFRRRKKCAKKSLGHLRLCPRPRNAQEVENVIIAAVSRDNRFLQSNSVWALLAAAIGRLKQTLVPFTNARNV